MDEDSFYQRAPWIDTVLAQMSVFCFCFFVPQQARWMNGDFSTSDCAVLTTAMGLDDVCAQQARWMDDDVSTRRPKSDVVTLGLGTTKLRHDYSGLGGGGEASVRLWPALRLLCHCYRSADLLRSLL